MTRADVQEPAQAFECFLSGIKPGPPYVRWSDEASLRVEQLIANKDLMIEVKGEETKSFVLLVA